MAILKKKLDAVVATAKVEPAAEAPEVPVCQAPIDGKPCGKPLATGQNFVCQEHVRAG